MRYFLILFWALFFFSENSFASGFVLECPSDRAEHAFESTDWCDNLNSYELFSKNTSFQDEFDIFDKTLTEAYRDNISNPEFVVQKLVHEFRIHKECLLVACHEVLEQCGAENIAMQQNLTQDKWCQEKVGQVLEFQKTKIYSMSVANQARKERSLLKQKFVALSKRFYPWIHNKMAIVISKFENFADKLERAKYKYVENPKE